MMNVEEKRICEADLQMRVQLLTSQRGMLKNQTSFRLHSAASCQEAFEREAKAARGRRAMRTVPADYLLMRGAVVAAVPTVQGGAGRVTCTRRRAATVGHVITDAIVSCVVSARWPAC
eukprot:6192386-Pleurochrysis_carterae.AAC.1